jgi:hypothetical protein
MRAHAASRRVALPQIIQQGDALFELYPLNGGRQPTQRVWENPNWEKISTTAAAKVRLSLLAR